MITQRSFPTLLSTDLPAARDFYVDLFGFEVAFESSWFVNLTTGGEHPRELGFLAHDHELVPAAVRGNPGGVILTFEVEDVDALVARASERGVTVLEAPRDLFYGQRRAVLVDPDGTLIDVSSPCDPDPAWMKRVGPREGGGWIEEEGRG